MQQDGSLGKYTQAGGRRVVDGSAHGVQGPRLSEALKPQHRPMYRVRGVSAPPANGGLGGSRVAEVRILAERRRKLLASKRKASARRAGGLCSPGSTRGLGRSPSPAGGLARPRSTVGGVSPLASAASVSPGSTGVGTPQTPLDGHGGVDASAGAAAPPLADVAEDTFSFSNPLLDAEGGSKTSAAGKARQTTGAADAKASPRASRPWLSKSPSITGK